MGISKDIVKRALATVPGAAAGSNLVTGDHVLWVSACDTYASVRLQWRAGAAADELERVAQAARQAVTQAGAAIETTLDSFIVDFVDHAGTIVKQFKYGGMTGGGGSAGTAAKPPATTTPPAGGAGHEPIPGLKPSPNPQGKAHALPGVKQIIAVGAGKGGVGKSTVALNLAVGLARQGHAVGLLDADIYGPSMPTMLGLDGLDAIVREKQLEPFCTHGIKAMTMGKLVGPDQPLIWRGPMAHGAFKQLTEQTNWGQLDYLIIDLPPGTGDVALTMAQMMQLAGAVVVCTPQKVAQDDAVRAAKMFRQLGIEVLGVVENMSCFVGDDGKVYDIFGRGGAEMMAQRLGVPFLGAIPITMSLRANSDEGNPTANFTGADPAGKRLTQALEGVVQQVKNQVALAQMRSGAVKPTLSIS
jgi:ATP-binding protein involved in chromosome partitioning